MWNLQTLGCSKVWGLGGFRDSAEEFARFTVDLGEAGVEAHKSAL